jgi:formate-dependent nitrite reductase membrane component NrfD
MLVNTTPGGGGLILRPESPMSVGVWALSLFSAFALVSFLGALGRPVGVARLVAGRRGTALTVVGAVLGLFVASYTGVLLSVSNEAVWSDTWTLGGLFLASGMSAAAVVVAVAARRRSAAATERRLAEADGWFALVELLFVVLLFLTLAAAGSAGTLLGHGWALLWVVVALGVLAPLLGLARRGNAGAMTAVAPVLVILGVLALRAVIIFSPQV